MSTRIEIHGLKELRAAFRSANPKLAKHLQVANKRIAARVVEDAKPRIKALPSPGGGKAMSGIRPNATQRAASIALLKSNPTIRANVFGTLSHKVFGRNVSGHGPWLPWIGRSWTPDQLYGLGPAIKDATEGFVLDEYTDAVMGSLDGLPQ